MSLTRLMRSGPGQTLEFVPTPESQLLAEMLVALANADGGTIVAGAFANGSLNPDVMVEDIESALLSAQNLCRPPVSVEWRPSGADSGLPVQLIVPRSPDFHSLTDGRSLIRSGRTNRPLVGEELLRAALSKRSEVFEIEPQLGATREDLDQVMVDEYIRGGKKSRHRPIVDSEDEILQEIGAITADGTPTKAGILLFGRNPQKFMPKSGIVFVRLSESDDPPSGPESSPELYKRRVELAGPIPRLIGSAIEVLEIQLSAEKLDENMQRGQVGSYPFPALREAVVNAVIHRDYQLSGRRIEIRMYDDKLVIVSPGKLPGWVTPANLVDEQYSRNPRIVDGVMRWGYNEDLGSGIDRMIKVMTEAGLPSPKFTESPSSPTFSVTFFNRLERSPMFEWEGSMNERQLKALTYVQEYERITNREYRELCPHVSGETIRLDLVDLVSRGILLKIGDKRGTYYIFKAKPQG